MTEQIAAKRLRQLVDAGLLERKPYQVPGQRTRYKYVLTDRRRDLFPVLISLIEFGGLLQGEPLRRDTTFRFPTSLFEKRSADGKYCDTDTRHARTVPDPTAYIRPA